jgi:GH15 family glucan-1,4-alpha-glucosidase
VKPRSVAAAHARQAGPKSRPIEDYALIGNQRTAALVGRDGSIDWLCLPRFDSRACFAALLGDRSHGHWQIAPLGGAATARRSYRDDTLVLDTEFETADGAVRLTDFMPLLPERNDLVRLVHGLRGRVRMRCDLVLRFDDGSVVPWVRRLDGGIVATAGPDAVALHSRVATHGEEFTTVAEFEIAVGQELPFVLTYFPSHEPTPLPIDGHAACEMTCAAWRRWIADCCYEGKYAPQVRRSLLTLKALTYAPTGGIVAAPTTSLPERLGGVRNWDYRYCWLRDAALTIAAMLECGFVQEAASWRSWLLRAAAGRPQDLQVMYGLHGERRLTEQELPWLPGYENSAPVRTGNAASRQLQLDVYGEVMDSLHDAHRENLPVMKEAWRVQRVLMDFLETAWRSEDSGIWEVRGEPRHFTHSKMMCWVAFDRAIWAAERAGLDGPIDRWRTVRRQIFDEVVDRGFDAGRNTFTREYGGRELDASLLRMPLMGFLPASDARMAGTVAAIERELLDDGFVLRYRSEPSADGMPGGEGAFLPCSFWLVENYALQGRIDEAHALFERLLAVGNDLGLLAEEYDPRARRLLGNFPQAFSHVALIHGARRLGGAGARHDPTR